ncbi:MAG: hypothetical protein RJA70_54 [Pseudomonadota bacterium]|jgi:hypothetical protein
MHTAEVDVRFGHDLAQVQDETGVDVLQLNKQLKLSVEERLLNLETTERRISNLPASRRQWSRQALPRRTGALICPEA